MTIHVFSDRFPYTFFDFGWLPRDFLPFCLIPCLGGFQSFYFHVCGIFGSGVLNTMATKLFASSHV